MAAEASKRCNVIKYLTNQHDLTRADLVLILGTTSRARKVLRGKEGGRRRTAKVVTRWDSELGLSGAAANAQSQVNLRRIVGLERKCI